MKEVTENATSMQPPKLLDQLRHCLRDKHYSLRSERVSVYWARWYIRLHKLRHPADMGWPEINAFLSNLAHERAVSKWFKPGCRAINGTYAAPTIRTYP